MCGLKLLLACSHPNLILVSLKPSGPTLDREISLQKKGFRFIAGVDEAGRGPIAGPVVAAACVVPNDLNIPGLNDSKLMSGNENFYLKKCEMNDLIPILGFSSSFSFLLTFSFFFGGGV